MVNTKVIRRRSSKICARILNYLAATSLAKKQPDSLKLLKFKEIREMLVLRRSKAINIRTPQRRIKINGRIKIFRYGFYEVRRGLTDYRKKKSNKFLAQYMANTEIRKTFFERMLYHLDVERSIGYYSFIFLNQPGDSRFSKRYAVNDKIVSKDNLFIKRTNINEYLFYSYISEKINNGHKDLEKLFPALNRAYVTKIHPTFTVTLKRYTQVTTAKSKSSDTEEFMRNIIIVMNGMGVDYVDRNRSNVVMTEDGMKLIDFESVCIQRRPLTLCSGLGGGIFGARDEIPKYKIEKFEHWLQKRAREYLYSFEFN